MDEAGAITRLQLEQIAAGTLQDRLIIERVESDAELLAQVEEIRRDNELLGELIAAEAAPAPSHDFDPIPGYELLDEIHRGGQGIVQRARQRTADRLVAVKTLLQGAFASEAQRHRFEREVKLAARLNHPSIVTVFESGRTAMGSHYIVMELIDGVPVDEYAAGLREAGDYRALAALFVEIADAVRYAHQRGVIHRDLKPGNILIDADGRPHILDFGIAQTFGEDTSGEPLTTRTGEFMGTLAYASPEQIASEPGLVDIRSDVYALGVLFYLALTGRRPIATAGSLAEVVLRIANEVPPVPSTINPALEPDLDTITMTALAKSVSERYQTAGDLRDDLTRWLEGRVISARAHDFWYVARKSLARHRVPVAIASVFLLVIVGSAIVTGVLALQLQRENRTLNGAVGGLTNALKQIDRETASQPITNLQGLLTELVGQIQNEIGDRPDVDSAVREAAGIAFLDDDNEKAAVQLERAYELRRSYLTPPHPDLATSLQNLGRVRFKQRRYEDARAYYEQALEMRETLYGREHADVARTMHHLAFTLQELGHLPEAERYWVEVYEIRRRVLPAGHSDVANTLAGLARNRLERGEYREAVATARMGLELVLRDPAIGPDGLPVGRMSHTLGVALCHLGELDEAERVLRDTLRIKLAVERDVAQVARSRCALGRVLFARGRLDEAEVCAQRAIHEREAGLKLEAQEINPELLLAEIALARDDPDAALAFVEAGLALADAGRSPSHHWDRGVALSIRARCLLGAARAEEAWTDAAGADGILTRSRPDTDARVRENLRLLASLGPQVGRDAVGYADRLRAAESGASPSGEERDP